MMSEQEKEIQKAERRCAREVRTWKRHLSEKLNSMSSSEERVRYLNESAAKVCAEHGIKLTPSKE
ncbi:MAG: hypothetical protein Ta2A_21620 [Treponemataceae bacterium]|nr:MAG: hypothetical protein Ta2A_21620 [Treponemataceae bacterium]